MTELRKKVLIVDDEESIRESLKLLLQRNFEVSLAVDGNEAIDCVNKDSPDLILLDLMMPKIDGIETLKKIREKNDGIPVIMLTGASTVKTAVEAMKHGARDYLNKPFDVDELTSLIINLLDQTGAIGSVEARGDSRRSIPAEEADFGSMVGQSVCIKEVFQKVTQIAETGTTVLITGESGTGKELIARQIHNLSLRKDKPFVAINCAAIPETLIESELFGHEKGAFTNAYEKRIGHFELADGGTLFLDEIGELSLSVQVKMLRFLQEQEFYRVGRSKSTKVDVRIITATNKDLLDLIKEKKFREDLYYRLNVISINIPKLRDRFEDIPLMVNHFVRRFSKLYGKESIEINKEALDVLVEYDWPGNVRELENVVESLIALCSDKCITAEMLPRKVKAPASDLELFKTQVFEGSLAFEDAERAFESDMIIKALKKTNYVQTRAAELLGISRRILKYKMDKLGIGDNSKESTS